MLKERSIRKSFWIYFRHDTVDKQIYETQIYKDKIWLQILPLLKNHAQVL